MARKSRKQIAVEEPVIESVSSEVFSTAIYARLSGFRKLPPAGYTAQVFPQIPRESPFG